MDKKISVTAIVPAYNEAPRISQVLSFLTNCTEIDEVIVVDKMDDNPWKPQAILTSQTEEVTKAAGTKYSAAPVFKVLKSNDRLNSKKEVS